MTQASIQVNIMYKEGHWINEDLANSLMELVKSMLPGMEQNVDYELKIICGSDFWGGLKKGDRLQAGEYIASQVAKGSLPLDFGEDTGTKHKTYHLK